MLLAADAVVNVEGDGDGGDYVALLDAHESVENGLIAVLKTCHQYDSNLNRDMDLVDHLHHHKENLMNKKHVN